MSGAAGGGSRFTEAWREKLPLLIVAWGIAAYLCFTRNIFNDGDTSWHLGAGQLILATRSIPDVDPFSFTFREAPWTAHEWLAEVVMAGALALGGWGGLALLFAAAVGLTLLLMGSELQRHLPPLRGAAALLVVIILLAPFMLARPHVLVWPILAGWALLLLRAREGKRAPPLAAAALMIVWANLHGSFIFGILLIGAFALEALIEEQDRRRAFTRWALFGIAAVAASLLTPHGVHGYLFPLQVSGMEALPLIQEWRRTDLRQDWLFLVILAAALVLLLLRRPRVSPARLVLLAGLVYLALAHVRHQPLLAIVGTLALAAPLARGREETAENAAPPQLLPLTSLLLLALAPVAAVRLSIDIPRADSPSNPISAIAALPPELRDRPVLNSYGFGGPLILAGIRPFIDGRADMYGDRFVFDHNAIVGGDLVRFKQATDRWGIGWTILSPSTPLTGELDRMPGWKRVYADRWAVVHVRAR
jgi:hypothetical protein